MRRQFHNYDAWKLRSPDDEAEERQRQNEREIELRDSADERNELAEERRRLESESKPKR